MAVDALIARQVQRYRDVFYGWKLVGLTLLLMSLASGTIWYGTGLWVKTLEVQFGWSRTQLTGAFSLAQLEGSLLGPLIGMFIDRLGANRMVLIGLIVIGLGFILFSRTTNLPIFYISFAMIMLGSAAGVWLPMMAAINNWFVADRVKAMAIAGEGQFVGGLLLAPVLAWALTPGHLEWRATALGIGVVFLAVALPSYAFIRNRPGQGGQASGGKTSGDASSGAAAPGRRGRGRAAMAYQPSFTVKQAMRTRAFWLIAFGHALSSMLIGTLIVHFVPMLTDQGLSLQTAAYLWSVVMAVAAVFLLVGGYVGDRIPKNAGLFIFCSIQAVGFITGAFANNVAMALIFAVLFGIGFGGRVAITTAIRGDYFGQRAFATITGISMVPLYGAMVLAPLMAARMFDTRGSYTLSFIILGSLGALSGALFLFAKKPVLPEAAAQGPRAPVRA